jgi:hypothetical protein
MVVRRHRPQRHVREDALSFGANRDDLLWQVRKPREVAATLSGIDTLTGDDSRVRAGDAVDTRRVVVVDV